MAVPIQGVGADWLEPWALPQPPEDATVFGPGDLRNAGLITLRVDKVANMPFCRNYGGFREHASREEGLTVSTGYYVPWTARKAWLNYMMGYASSKFTDLGDPAPRAVPLPAELDNQGLPIPVRNEDFEGEGVELIRVIPYQCPEPQYEQLFCVDIQLNEPKGAVEQSPFTVVRDVLGRPVDNQGFFLDDGIPGILANWPMYLDNESRGLRPLPRPGQKLADEGDILGDGRRQDGWADYTVTFKDLPFEVRTDEETDALALAFPQVPGELQRYVIRKFKQAIQSQPLPKGALVWGANNTWTAADALRLGALPVPLDNNNQPTLTPIPENAAFILQPTCEIVYIWEDLPDPPYATMFGCMGKVNINDFDGALGSRLYPKGTLLCQAPQYERLPRFITGRIRWRVTYTFMYRPAGWNNFVGPTGAYYPVSLQFRPGGLKRPIYQGADFNTLFIPPVPINYQQ